MVFINQLVQLIAQVLAERIAIRFIFRFQGLLQFLPVNGQFPDQIVRHLVDDVGNFPLDPRGENRAIVRNVLGQHAGGDLRGCPNVPRSHSLAANLASDWS